MKSIKAGLCVIFIICVCGVSRAGELSDLRKLVEKQQTQLEEQKRLINVLMQKVSALETGKKEPQKEITAKSRSVDLSYEEVKPETVIKEEHILEKEWFKRIDFSGFGAAGFVQTGKEANRSNGGFLNYEASLFVEAQVWENISFFTELQTIRLGDEDTKFARTAEAYAHFKNPGLKLGRMDIPIGEEYLWQDAIDNPLITYSVSWPYGWDEGALFYGHLGKLGWVASVMDGSDVRGTDDDTDKALNLKLYGNPVEPLYLSASFMRNGEAAKSALEFSGSHIEPVGRGGHSSSLGTSPSAKVDSYLYELDAKYSFAQRGYLALTFGQCFIDDAVSAFDRDFLYFTAEPLYNLNDRLYLIARFSGIGTFDSGKGYHFDGKPYAGGNNDFGYDTKSLLRWAIGLGYKPNPRVVVKLEYSHDDFELISASTKDGGDDGRGLIGAQVAVKF